MDQELAKRRVVDQISEVGELTRQVSQRYEAIFSSFYGVLVETLDDATSMADAARFTMEMADTAVEGFRTNFVGQPRFACAKGCSACCHLIVAIPPGVAEAMAEHIDAAFSGEERDALILRLEEAVARFRDAEDPQAVRAPCPLLNDEGGCSVYEVRPLSCRSFTSTSLPRCQQVVFGPNPTNAGVEQNPARYRIYEYATRALEEAARRRGLPGQQQALSAALLAQLSP